MEGREEGWLSSVLGDHLRKHLAEGFLGNVDFVDKIYGGNVGEYLAYTNSLTLLPVYLISRLRQTLFVLAFYFCRVASLYQLQSQPAELDKTYFYYLLLIQN